MGIFSLFKSKPAPVDPVTKIADDMYRMSAAYPPDIDTDTFANESNMDQNTQGQHRYRWKLLGAVFTMNIYKQACSQPTIEAATQAFWAKCEAGGIWLPEGGVQGAKAELAAVDSRFGPRLLDPAASAQMPDFCSEVADYVFGDASPPVSQSVGSGLTLVFGTMVDDLRKEAAKLAKQSSQPQA